MAAEIDRPDGKHWSTAQAHKQMRSTEVEKACRERYAKYGNEHDLVVADMIRGSRRFIWAWSIWGAGILLILLVKA